MKVVEERWKLWRKDESYHFWRREYFKFAQSKKVFERYIIHQRFNLKIYACSLQRSLTKWAKSRNIPGQEKEMELYQSDD